MTTSCDKNCFTRRIPPFTLPDGADPLTLQAIVVIDCATTADTNASSDASSFSEITTGVYSSCYTIDCPPGTAVAEVVQVDKTVDEVTTTCNIYAGEYNIPGLCERDLDNIVAKLLTVSVCDDGIKQSPYWRDLRQNTLGMFILALTQNQNWVKDSSTGRASLDVVQCGQVITTLYMDITCPTQTCTCTSSYTKINGCCSKCGCS
jgi:hypothetical protein